MIWAVRRESRGSRLPSFERQAGRLDHTLSRRLAHVSPRLLKGGSRARQGRSTTFDHSIGQDRGEARQMAQVCVLFRPSLSLATADAVALS